MAIFNKNKIIKVLAILVIATGMSLAGSSYAAPDDLVVEFESTPLFNEVNFLPGDTVTRTVEVTNNTGSSKNIIIEVINITDPDDFSEVLNIIINENESELYSDTLSNFFGAGEVNLSSLAGSGGSATYNFSISFISSSSNNYQENNLGFDIVIGFKGEDGGGGEGQGGGGSGGGGGGGVSAALTILNETVEVLDIETTSVTIVWNTSYRSTSRVVYGTSPNLFDFNSTPNYGYPFSTVESDSPALSDGVFNHSVTITDLTPGTTYYFRTISHASPDSISFEKTFSTIGSNNQEVNEGGFIDIQSSGLNFNQSGQIAITGLSNTNSGNLDETSFDDINEPNEINNKNGDAERVTNNFLAFIGGIFWPINWRWLIIPLGIVSFFIYLNYKKGKQEKE